MDTFPFLSSSVMARFDSNGQLDSTFGSGGLQSVTGGEASALAIYPNGKILVAGTTAGLIKSFKLICLTEQGALDTTFGNNGQVVTSFPFQREANGNAIAVDQEGRILVAGTVGMRFALARFLENGGLDLSFGDAGRVITDIRFAGVLQMGEQARAVVVSLDGGIFVAGFAVSSIAPIGKRFAIARYTQDGRLDINFGRAGILLPNLFTGSDETAFAMAIDSNGRLVIAGHLVIVNNENNDTIFVVARFNPDGSFDNEFAVQGFRPVRFGAQSVSAKSVAIDRNGRIILAGEGFMRRTLQGRLVDRRIALTRLLADGQFDNTFHSNGEVFGTALTDFVTPADVGANAVAIDPNNQLVVVGDGNEPAFLVARYSVNGFLDTNFGNNGSVVTLFNIPPTPFPPPTRRPFDFGGATSVAIDRHGRIVVAGTMGFN